MRVRLCAAASDSDAHDGAARRALCCECSESRAEDKDEYVDVDVDVDADADIGEHSEFGCRVEFV